MSPEANPSRWETAGKPSSPMAESGRETLQVNRAMELSTAGAAAAPARANTSAQEQRRHPRFKCEGNLELKTDGGTIRTWATFTDISTTGCYVEMMTTFPVGTKMELQLGMNGFLVVGTAIVRATYPFGYGHRVPLALGELPPAARFDGVLGCPVQRTKAGPAGTKRDCTASDLATGCRD